MSTPPASTGPSTTFLVGTFAIAIAVGVLIAYFGIKGQLGAGIP
ncbi:MAG TPA: hypothetical protein VK423_05260 [Thermoplasmata archaeon]|nr:hypothetical protein [Thermoplasmata archaeon]